MILDRRGRRLRRLFLQRRLLRIFFLQPFHSRLKSIRSRLYSFKISLQLDDGSLLIHFIIIVHVQQLLDLLLELSDHIDLCVILNIEFFIVKLVATGQGLDNLFQNSNVALRTFSEQDKGRSVRRDDEFRAFLDPLCNLPFTQH